MRRKSTSDKSPDNGAGFMRRHVTDDLLDDESAYTRLGDTEGELSDTDDEHMRRRYASVKSPAIEQFMFPDYETVYRNIAVLPKRDRVERLAYKLGSRWARYPAITMVWILNRVANHPIKSAMASWAILQITHFFDWVATSKDASGPGIFYTSTNLTFLCEAAAVISLLVFSAVWRKIRGPKKADHRHFLDFHNKAKHVLEKMGINEKVIKAILDPQTPEECVRSVAWNNAFAKGLPREAKNFFLQSLTKTFPTGFDNVVRSSSSTHEPTVVRLSATRSTVDTIEEHNKKATLERVVERASKTYGARFAPDVKNSSERYKNRNTALSVQGGLLDDLKAALAIREIKEVSVQPISPPVLTPVPLQQPDIYDWPLICPRPDLPLKIPKERFFSSATNEERKKASKANWRDRFQTSYLRREVKLKSRNNVALQVLDYTHQLSVRHVNPLDTASGKNQAISNLRADFAAVLSDPFAGGKALTPEVEEKLVSKCLHLVTLMRPVITDGQWKNWRYFYAQDEIVTEAFKRLSPQQKAWMIYSLMSGNDAGKLLVLSILQDPRLPTTYFGSAEYLLDTPTNLKNWWQNSIVTLFYDWPKDILVFFFNPENSILAQLFDWQNSIFEGFFNWQNSSLSDFLYEYIRQFGYSGNDIRSHLSWFITCFGERFSELLNVTAYYPQATTVGSEILKQLTTKLPSEPGAKNQRIQNAQGLFWSIKDPKKQELLLHEMEHGHKTKQTRGVKGSTQPLYFMETTGSIKAIKNGVLKSRNLAPLHPLLISSEKEDQNQAYRVLAVLLDEGMEFQEAFQKLVKKYYRKIVVKGRLIEGFEEWLEQVVNKQWLEDRGIDDDAAIRARFVAGILREIQSRYSEKPSKRAEKIREALRLFYPQAHLFEAFNAIKLGFRGDAWPARKRIFKLVLTDIIMRQGIDGLENTLQALSYNDDTDVLADIVDNGLKDCITAKDVSIDTLRRVHSYGDLLSSTIEIIYAKYGVLQRLKEYIADPELPENTCLNLTAILINGLFESDSQREFNPNHHPDFYVEIYKVLRCFCRSWGVSEHKLLPAEYFTQFNQVFKNIKIKRSHNTPLTLESVYIDMSLYFLRQVESGNNNDLERKLGWECLSAVVMRPELHQNITLQERQKLGEILPLLVNRFGRRGLGYSQSDSGSTHGMHRSLVHMTLAIFFNDISDIEILDYASKFLDVCKRVGEGNAAYGLQILVAGIREDAVYSVEDIIPRMQALALYAEHERIPSRFRLIGGQQNITREGCHVNMKAISGLQDNLKSVYTALQDFGMPDVTYNAIHDVVVNPEWASSSGSEVGSDGPSSEGEYAEFV